MRAGRGHSMGTSLETIKLHAIYEYNRSQTDEPNYKLSGVLFAYRVEIYVSKGRGSSLLSTGKSIQPLVCQRQVVGTLEGGDDLQCETAHHYSGAEKSRRALCAT